MDCPAPPPAWVQPAPFHVQAGDAPVPQWAKDGAQAGATALVIWGATSVCFPNQPDKLWHALACGAISGTVRCLTQNPWCGLGTAVAVGLAKEWVDSSPLYPEGDRDLKLNGDLGADLLGGLVGMNLAYRF